MGVFCACASVPTINQLNARDSLKVDTSSAGFAGVSSQQFDYIPDAWATLVLDIGVLGEAPDRCLPDEGGASLQPCECDRSVSTTIATSSSKWMILELTMGNPVRAMADSVPPLRLSTADWPAQSLGRLGPAGGRLARRADTAAPSTFVRWPLLPPPCRDGTFNR